jgi:hypothetical protein
MSINTTALKQMFKKISICNVCFTNKKDCKKYSNDVDTDDEIVICDTCYIKVFNSHDDSDCDDSESFN